MAVQRTDRRNAESGPSGWKVTYLTTSQLRRRELRRRLRSVAMRIRAPFSQVPRS
jgi:hypothetical protein